MKLLNKPDIVITTAALGAALFSVLFLFAQQETSSGGYAKVTVFGELVAKLPLDMDVPSTEISTERGINVLEIVSGKVRISFADCRDALCVKQGAISEGGQKIVCLPHGLVVEITGQEYEIDAFVR